jgi:hypothetical protein
VKQSLSEKNQGIITIFRFSRRESADIWRQQIDFKLAGWPVAAIHYSSLRVVGESAWASLDNRMAPVYKLREARKASPAPDLQRPSGGQS